MKILILLLLTFNIYASERMIITDLRDNSVQGNEVVESHVDAMARIVAMGKMGKKNWREGEFNLIADNSLYSKIEDVTTYEDQGETRPIYSYDDETGEIVAQIGIENVLTEVITPTTFYYHPTNWSYSLAPLTQIEIDSKLAEKAKTDRKIELKNMSKTKDLTLKEINEYFFR